tara:strand:- start:9497 stop:9787 length:291 start_codon:yes stop_codon:yes gene_type:complete
MTERKRVFECEVGKKYCLAEMKDGDCIVELVEITRFPALGTLPSYKFKYLSGNDALLEDSCYKNENCFPIQQEWVMSFMTFYEATEEEIESTVQES